MPEGNGSNKFSFEGRRGSKRYMGIDAARCDAGTRSPRVPARFPQKFGQFASEVDMGAAEYVKDVAEFVKKFNDIELNRRILKLEEEVIDLTRDKRRPDNKIEELERALKSQRSRSPSSQRGRDQTPQIVAQIIRRTASYLQAPSLSAIKSGA
jgi:hypothetical protein